MVYGFFIAGFGAVLAICDGLVYAELGAALPGVMDRVRLEQQCLREGANFPLPASHLDIQAIAMERFGWWRRRSLLRTLAALKRPFVGSHHSALADATNAAYVFRDVLKPGNN